MREREGEGEGGTVLPHECTRWPMGCKSVANKPWWNFVTRDRVTRYLEPAIPLTEREREREKVIE